MRLKTLLFLITSVVFFACERNPDEPKNNYLISYQEQLSYTAEQVQTQLQIAKILYPAIDSIIPESKYGVIIYKVKYKTTFLGNDIDASGLICIPDAEEQFPVMSFQNETNICYSNAPSRNITNPLYSLVEMLSGNGYIIVIPDYIGFGTSEQVLHPYYHVQSSNSAVIDMIKASVELLDKKGIKATSNNNLYLMGYSQGGWATLSALKEIENNPLENLTLSGASCGAGAYDLMEMGRYVMNLTEYKNPFYFPYFIESHRRNGLLNEPLSLYFNEPYSQTIPGLFNGARCNSEMNDSLTTSIADLFTPALILNFETSSGFAGLRKQLSENSVTAWNLHTKTMFYHSTGDKSIPYQQSVLMNNSLISSGTSSELLTLKIIVNDTIDHNDAIVDWGITTISWFNSIR